MRAFSWFVLPQFGAELGAPALHRLLAMLAHYHGQILNVAELSTALNVAQATRCADTWTCWSSSS